MCTPEFMQGLQVAMARSGMGSAAVPPGVPGAGAAAAPPRPGLPATAGVPIRLPPGTPPMPAGAAATQPPGGMATGGGGLSAPPVQGSIPNAQPAPPGGFPRPAGLPGYPAPPASPAPPQPLGGAAQAGVSAAMPPGAGVRGMSMPASGLSGRLPVRPVNALPRSSLRRGGR